EQSAPLSWQIKMLAVFDVTTVQVHYLASRCRDQRKDQTAAHQLLSRSAQHADSTQRRFAFRREFLNQTAVCMPHPESRRQLRSAQPATVRVVLGFRRL